MNRKVVLIILGLGLTISSVSAEMTGEEIIKRVDQNYIAGNRKTVSKMTVRGKRRDIVMESVSWVIGTEKSYSEYLSPARQKGTKMLKLGDELWMYSPDADRIIKIAGHMLKKSMMGSDLSYEDMMEDVELLDVYDAKLEGKEVLEGKECYKVELTAKDQLSDISYSKRVIWVDTAKYLPMQEELYAKSGKLMKRFVITETMKIGSRWYPEKMVFKDMLSSGDGTEFEILALEFDVPISESLFTKASLKK